MNKLQFLERLKIAGQTAREFAASYVIEELPVDLCFSIDLYDDPNDKVAACLEMKTELIIRFCGMLVPADENEKGKTMRRTVSFASWLIALVAGAFLGAWFQIQLEPKAQPPKSQPAPQTLR